MSQYLQTSTSNPYGRRPWQTRLTTEFEDYGFLKQPQNTILREDLSMRPEIYKPPEMKEGLGDVTVVGGSGKILRRGRQRQRGLGYFGPQPNVMLSNGGGTSSFLRVAYEIPNAAPRWPPVAQPVPQPVRPALIAPAPTPITILPPSLVPPPPTVVSSGPSGTVYALPGDATTPGSPFAPPPPGQLPAAPAAATTDSSRSFSDWFNASDYISSVPNGYLALGAAAVLYFFSRKKR